jgi:hypothetical protein
MRTKPIFRLSLLAFLASLLLTQLACGLTSGASKTPTQVGVNQPVTTQIKEASQPTELPILQPTQPPAPSAPEKAGQPPAGSQSGMELITAAVRNTLGVYPRITNASIQDSAQNHDTQIRIENAAPGIGHSTVEQDGVTLMEIILITPTLYVKQGQDWLPYPSDQASAYASIFTENIDPQTYMQQVDPTVKISVTSAGQESLNGIDASVYDVVGTFTDGTQSTGKIWIGVQDQRIYQYTVQTSDGKTVQEQYDYNTAVNIEAPVTGQAPQSVPVGVSDLASMDMCQAVPGEFVSGVMGRSLASDPQPFEDDYLGKGCQYDGGSDSTAAYFAYVSLAPIASFEDSHQNGFKVVDVPELGVQAFTVNAADAEQLWVKLSEDMALVVAIGDVPNPDGARQIALYYLSLMGK